MLNYIDIHSHSLTKPSNVKRIHNFLSAEDHAKQLIEEKYFSIGLHPWYINKLNVSKEINYIQSLANEKSFVAIGETGIDKVIERDIAFQKLIFYELIELSEELKRPLIIHSVKGSNEVVTAFKTIKPSQKWIIHGFNQRWSVAESFLENEILLSFGSSLLKNETTREVFKKMPLGSYFLESDESDDEIETIFAEAATLSELPLETIQFNLEQQFNQLFTR
jgi:TatD DNase family protein